MGYSCVGALPQIKLFLVARNFCAIVLKGSFSQSVIIYVCTQTNETVSLAIERKVKINLTHFTDRHKSSGRWTQEEYMDYFLLPEVLLHAVTISLITQDFFRFCTYWRAAAAIEHALSYRAHGDNREIPVGAV